MPKMRLVVIDWLDSHSGDGWQSLAAIERNAETVRCRSVGWLLADTAEHAVVVPHLSGVVNERTVPYGRGELSIPKRSIVKMRTLQRG